MSLISVSLPNTEKTGSGLGLRIPIHDVHVQSYHCFRGEKHLEVLIKREVRMSGEPLEKDVQSSLSLVQKLLTVLIKVPCDLFPWQRLWSKNHKDKITHSVLVWIINTYRVLLSIDYYSYSLTSHHMHELL